MGRVLFMIKYYYNSRKYVTLTLDMWPWLVSLTLTLIFDLVLHWCFEEQMVYKINIWRHVTQKRYVVRYIRDNSPDRYFFKEHDAPNQMFLRLPVPKVWFKRWFWWLSICLTLTLTFQGHLIFENSPFVPVHNWYTFRSDMFINSGDIAHWNMEKLPILYNGDLRCHGNVCYVFRINAYFCKLYRIGPSNMRVNFGNNR